jgi:hypothetical protein
MSSPYSVTPAVTRTEAQFRTAETDATAYIAQRIKTPQQALAYIDAQGNSTAGNG